MEASMRSNSNKVAWQMAVSLLVFLFTHVSAERVAAQEVVLRDYTAPSYWEGMWGYPVGEMPGVSAGGVPITVGAGNRKLARLGMVLAHGDSELVPNAGHLDTMEWRVLVWSSQAAFFADPAHADVGNGGFEFEYAHPTNPGYLNPIGGGSVQLYAGWNAYYIEVDVRSRNIVLNPGQEYWVALLPIIGVGDGIVVGGLHNQGGGMNPLTPWLDGDFFGYPVPSPFPELNWVDPEGMNYIGMRDGAAVKVTSMPHTKPQIHHTPWAARLLPCIPGISC